MYKIENWFGDIVKTFNSLEELNTYQEELHDIFNCILILNYIEDDCIYFLIRDEED